MNTPRNQLMNCTNNFTNMVISQYNKFQDQTFWIPLNGYKRFEIYLINPKQKD